MSALRDRTTSGGMLRRILGPWEALILGRGRAATTIELAVMASLFTGMLTLIVQLGILYLYTTTLDAALQIASRQIMLGNAPASSVAFVQSIKTASGGVLSSQTVYAAVQSGSTFQSITPIANIASGSGSTTYSPGTNGSAVVVQAGLTASSFALGWLPSSITAISSTIAFKVEPTS